MQDIKKTFPVYQSLTRPILMSGGERENVIVVTYFSAAIWLTGKDFVAMVIAGFVWIVGSYFCRLVANHDPYMTKVYLKSTRYEGFYPARERLVTQARARAGLTKRKLHA